MRVWKEFLKTLLAELAPVIPTPTAHAPRNASWWPL